MTKARFKCIRLALVGAAIVSSSAWAAYPDKPVKLLVGFAPGGGVDIIGRLIAKELTLMWGQSVVVENRPGANGVISMTALTRLPPDGYSLALGSSASLTMSGALGKIPFDLNKDFTPIVLLVDGPHALTVNAKLPVTTLREFTEYAKKASPPLKYSSPGIGNGGHLGMEMLKQEANIDLTHIPYTGAAPALNDMIGGHVDAYFASAAAILPHANAGTVRVLAVTSKERVPMLPNVPTITEAGVPNFKFQSWGSLMGPAGMPADIVAKINSDVNKIIQTASFREALKQAGFMPLGGTAEQLKKLMTEDCEQWKSVVRKGNIKGD